MTVLTISWHAERHQCIYVECASVICTNLRYESSKKIGSIPVYWNFFENPVYLRFIELQLILVILFQF